MGSRQALLLALLMCSAPSQGEGADACSPALEPGVGIAAGGGNCLKTQFWWSTVGTLWALLPTWCSPAAPCAGLILVRKGLCLGQHALPGPLHSYLLLVLLGAFGTLGVGAGFALGAKLCRPDAEVSQGAGGRRLGAFRSVSQTNEHRYPPRSGVYLGMEPLATVSSNLTPSSDTR